MKYKVFETLKSLTLAREMNGAIAESNIQAAIIYLIEEQSIITLKLFSAIFNLYVSKECKHPFFQDSNKKTLQEHFAKDPSNFFAVYLYALSMFSIGEKKRAEQLFIRLENSGWKNKDIAKAMREKLLVERGICE
jgi:hypothetical protein